LFSGTTHGRNASCRYKLGFDKSGKLLAMLGESVLGSGGNADYAVNIITGMASAGTGPYHVDDLKLDVYGVYTNTPPIGAARGYGHPEVHLAVESLMDVAAEKLGIPPRELRIKNLLRPGCANGIGQVMHESNGNAVKCTEIVADKLFTPAMPKAAPYIAIGRGIASYMKMPCMPTNTPSGAYIKLNSDGSVSMSTGAVDMGQGLHTALAQIGAEALGLPFEKVHFQYSVDTLTSPYDWQTVASHSTWGAGNAVILASEDLKRKLREEGAKVFGTTADRVAAEAGEVRYNGRSLPWSRFAAGICSPDGSALTKPVMGQGYFVPQGIQNHDPETGQGNAAADWTQGCVGAEVAVDLRTGEATVLRLINAIDAGTIINPTLAKEQVCGAMLMAAGSVLSETVVYDAKTGKVRNDSLVDYKIPGIEDIPCETQVIFVQTPEKSGPYGAKGIGEHGTVGTAPALLNAIYDATGLRFHTLPASADRITTMRKGGEGR
jgi:carbon-monoxide dehydrogenase large subunit